MPEFTPPNAQQWTNDRTDDGMNPAEPGKPCPSEELREDGLRLIVGRVRHRDALAYSRFDQRTEIVVPRPPRCVFHITVLILRFLRNVNGSGVKLQPMLCGEFCDKPFVCIGRFAA